MVATEMRRLKSRDHANDENRQGLLKNVPKRRDKTSAGTNAQSREINRSIVP